ncbi:Hydroxyacid oxidase [Metarhizium brunneum]|uniref:Hydroxyacid oxidase n=1 Tax=Metarhizium brunneum TaxID=500148 RepID=A0A7D5Z6N3_9HYPO|nr:Hydroxyacid oxidase [Metarhizium brunneum]
MEIPNPASKPRQPDPITVAEVEAIAAKALSKQIYEFYASGSDEQKLLKRNMSGYDRLYIVPRVLRDVSDVDTRVEMFGSKLNMPIGIAPSAMQRLAGRGGEIDVARAALHERVNFTLSSQSTTSLENVMVVKTSQGDSTPTPDFWFQIYLTQDLDKSVDLIKRAEVAGYKALVVTVDTPVLGNRVNERKNVLALPRGMRLANLEGDDADSAKTPTPTRNRLLMDARTKHDAKLVVELGGGEMHASNLSWAKTLSFLRDVTSMKIVLKGVMTPQDARLAILYGADAIVVSNHGGRQLDEAPSTIEVLADIAHAVRGRIPIILDGGIRRGADVFKAIALGADLVWIGRPVLWGLAYDGDKGVGAVLNILERELSRTMALAGVREISEISSAYLAVANPTFGVTKL